ncbi:MAG TPA: cyclic nucleotide-binding domain-containing protein [Candidatus Dormibacteraeota bacterium]|nr:cyclic nucleotide-binding domain-containing protein [Candidatus Dormibacteraeota bacterium]
MASANVQGNGFKIWAVDGVVYGPVELPTLVGWVKEERVTATTWVYSEQHDAWRKAAEVPELRMFYRPKNAAGAPAAEAAPAASASAPAELKPGTLRRVKILADLSEAQLERFVTFMEIEPVRQWTEIVKQGQLGDAMYLVLEGELRVRMMIGGKETILVTLGTGEFFGEISLFDQGPRSADVVANSDTVLLKISAQKFNHLLTEAPELAAPFLFAIGKTLTARIRADNKRYRDSVNFARAAGS